MLESLSSSLSSPSVRYSSPPAYLFKFPPDPLPSTLPPPVKDHSLANPFTIPSNVYNGAFSVSIPITIAIVYATTVTLLNQWNKRDNKPWAISKTRPWLVFVILHNVFLALYSAWTCVGMVNAVATAWPGWKGEYGLAGAVDSMCKINGPRGLGDAATYNSTTNTWQLTNRALHLGADGLTPDSTDVGRIWNEGLAFYGWLFYLSKFYEVLDTLIILAKGKKSSFLQTYHHAGAMLCMWAGIRFMAPPIWMFVLVNSGIHALMYTYYTLTALSIRVPTAIKRTLTTLQITQFIVGASFAAAHLFIAYDIPVSVPYIFTIENLSSALPAASSTVSSVVASATASGDLSSYLKKLALRAGGAEGIAENVHNAEGETFGIDAVHVVQDAKAREDIRYQLEHRTIHCTDTSGQAFAIYLNCLYLFPLTLLFIRFFIRSYLKRSHAGETPKSRPIIEKAGKDAWKGVQREFMDAVGEMHGPDTVDETSTSKAGSNGKVKEVEAKKDEPAPVSADDSKEDQTAKESELENEKEIAKEEPEEPTTKEEAKEASDAIKNEGADAGDAEKDSVAYEANPDEMFSKEEKKAEEEM
jgi:hypothetical protein